MSGGGFPIPGFTPLKVLGSGASGQVVLARHDDSGTPVAVKFLSPELAADPSFREQFVAEARVLMDVDNPHVARLYEYVDTTSGPVIVMEAVNGVSLRELVGPEKQMPPEAALVVMKGSLLGLAAAHERGVVHRDYKPQNVLVREDGISKLLDFGIAVPAGAAAEVAGTPSYMAPEQWAGAPASPATDVYAVTATFFFCLTGSVPFPAQNLWELRLAHESGPVPVSSAPEPVQGLVAAGLAKDPAARPASAREFVDQLEAAAVAGYGADWEARGLKQLSGMVALAAMLLPFGPSLAPATFTSAVTVLKGSSVPARVIGGSLAALLVSLLAVQAAEPGKKAPDNFVFAAQSTTTLGATSSSTASSSSSPSSSAGSTPSSSASATLTPPSSASSTPGSTPPSATTTATTVVPTSGAPSSIAAPTTTSGGPVVSGFGGIDFTFSGGLTAPLANLVFNTATSDPRPIDLVINWGYDGILSSWAAVTPVGSEVVRLSGARNYSTNESFQYPTERTYCGTTLTVSVAGGGKSFSQKLAMQPCPRVDSIDRFAFSVRAATGSGSPSGGFTVAATTANTVPINIVVDFTTKGSTVTVSKTIPLEGGKLTYVKSATQPLPRAFCNRTVIATVHPEGASTPTAIDTAFAGCPIVNSLHLNMPNSQCNSSCFYTGTAELTSSGSGTIRLFVTWGSSRPIAYDIPVGTPSRKLTSPVAYKCNTTVKVTISTDPPAPFNPRLVTTRNVTYACPVIL